MKKKVSKTVNRAFMIITAASIIIAIVVFKLKEKFPEELMWLAYTLIGVFAVAAVVCFVLTDFGDAPDPEIIELTPEEEEMFDFLTENGEYNEDNDEDLFCPECGAAKRPGWLYCPECGIPFCEPERHCPNCEKVANDEWVYCVDCGTKIDNGDDSADEQPSEAVPYNEDTDRPCPRCKSGYMVGQTFCPTCGLNLKVKSHKCPSCGTPGADDWDFCAMCGYTLGSLD